MRLDEAIHRLPKYTQALLDAVEAKRMALRTKRWQRMLDWLKAEQSVKGDSKH